MIVDVLRNDLGRVCQPGSVRVPRLCRLERTAAVQHLVSTVTGVLAPDRDAFDLLAAAFPGGSITGAPKIRAMEILEGLEPVRRGPYTGAIGWIGPDGAMQTSIAIRTFVADGRRLTLHVGGGITWKSDPAAEWEETVTKARGPLSAIGAVEVAVSDGRARAPGRATDRPRLGRRDACSRPIRPHLGVRSRLPARRRHLRDAPRARRPRHGAGGTRRAPASIRCWSRYPAGRRPRPSAPDRDRGAARCRWSRRARRGRLDPDHGLARAVPRSRAAAAGRERRADGGHPGVAGRGRPARPSRSRPSPRRLGRSSRPGESAGHPQDDVPCRLRVCPSRGAQGGRRRRPLPDHRRPPFRGHHRQHLPCPTVAGRRRAGACDTVARVRDPAGDDPVLAARVGRAGRAAAVRGTADAGRPHRRR